MRNQNQTYIMSQTQGPSRFFCLWALDAQRAASGAQPGSACPVGSALRSEQTSPQQELKPTLLALVSGSEGKARSRELVSVGSVCFAKYLKAISLHLSSPLPHPKSPSTQVLGFHQEDTLIPASGSSSQEAEERTVNAGRVLSA